MTTATAKQEATMTTKKITKATLKSFVKRNRENLRILVSSRFDSMTDGVRATGDSTFEDVTPTSYDVEGTTLGIEGLWLVGGSRNYFSAFEGDTHTGIRVSNCCGSVTVAIRKSGGAELEIQPEHVAPDVPAGVQPEPDSQVCARVGGLEFTRRELSDLFDTVAPQTNWKQRIDTTVTRDLSDSRLVGLREAIIFYTGSVPTISLSFRDDGTTAYRVQADGYYQAIGA